jgi:uncharacterized membrane protein (UPF0127 family)
MYLKVINQNTNTVLFKQARKATTLFQRFLGLMFKRGMSEEEALIFYHAPSIHTFFMRFPIDVIFLDGNMRVIRICRGLKPARMIFCRGAFCTIECLGGLTPSKGVEENQTLRIGD